MRVIMFQTRFEEAIVYGQKRSTIRLRARCKAGDQLSLRRWQEKAYRSRQIGIKTVECRSVTPLTIGISSRGNFWVIRHRGAARMPELMNENNLRHLAKVEGFHSLDEMKEWFINNHKLQPGKGIEAEQIQW